MNERGKIARFLKNGKRRGAKAQRNAEGKGFVDCDSGLVSSSVLAGVWIPAFAGMTGWKRECRRDGVANGGGRNAETARKPAAIPLPPHYRQLHPGRIFRRVVNRLEGGDEGGVGADFVAGVGVAVEAGEVGA